MQIHISVSPDWCRTGHRLYIRTNTQIHKFTNTNTIQIKIKIHISAAASVYPDWSPPLYTHTIFFTRDANQKRRRKLKEKGKLFISEDQNAHFLYFAVQADFVFQRQKILISCILPSMQPLRGELQLPLSFSSPALEMFVIFSETQ